MDHDRSTSGRFLPWIRIKEISAIKQFIEDVGILFEEMGLPRMAGRLLGCLLICEPPYQSSEELASAVGASKGSISSMTRMLIQSGVVEKMGLPGKRGTYYRIRQGAWMDLMKVRIGHLRAIRQLAERGLAMVASKNPHRGHRLRELRDFHAFLERGISALLDRYEREKGVT